MVLYQLYVKPSPSNDRPDETPTPTTTTGRCAPLNNIDDHTPGSHNHGGAPVGRPYHRSLRLNLAFTVLLRAVPATDAHRDTTIADSTGAPQSRPLSEKAGRRLRGARPQTAAYRTPHHDLCVLLPSTPGVDYLLYGVDRHAASASLRRVDTPIKMSVRAVSRIWGGRLLCLLVRAHVPNRGFPSVSVDRPD
jgi:hypothetical protein